MHRGCLIYFNNIKESKGGSIFICFLRLLRHYLSCGRFSFLMSRGFSGPTTRPLRAVTVPLYILWWGWVTRLNFVCGDRASETCTHALRAGPQYRSKCAINVIHTKRRICRFFRFFSTPNIKEVRKIPKNDWIEYKVKLNKDEFYIQFLSGMGPFIDFLLQY